MHPHRHRRNPAGTYADRIREAEQAAAETDRMIGALSVLEGGLVRQELNRLAVQLNEFHADADTWRERAIADGYTPEAIAAAITGRYR